MIDPMDQLQQRFVDIDARLRNLEGGQRTGLSLLRSAWGTAAADPTVFAAYESGPAGSTWTDDAGNTGTGYPTITVTDCPARYMIFWSVRPINMANGATYRTTGVTVTIAINGVDVPPMPNARRFMTNYNALPIDASQSMIVARRDRPGINTFQMRALWQNDVPAAVNQPRLTDVYLGILPLSVA